ncbi:ubiquitin-protein ligase peroxin 12 [Chamberlinius hualienensis]
MAEHGAHLATVSSELPSIFEVLAQENLSSTLGPAFGHLVKVIAQVDIGTFEHLFKWHQEVFATLQFILQHYCLKSCGSSFSENFYGLKRTPLGDKFEFRTGYALPKSHHRRALACLVLIPYIRLKLDQFYEQINEQKADRTLIKDKWMKLKLMFLKIYPLIHLSWEVCILIYQVSYALGKTNFSSPLYHLAKTQLILTDEDSPQQPLLNLLSDLTNNGWLKIPNTLFHHLTSNTREVFTSALSIGTFFLQYLEWWYSNKNKSVISPVTLIPFPIKDSAQVHVPTGKICPVCLEQRKNDTALSTSG